MNLYPHQSDLLNRVLHAYSQGHRAVLMQGATGFGKTAVASEIIRRSVAKSKRVVFAAHLDALIDDTSERLSKAGVPHGIVQASRPSNPTAPVQVASLATLHRRGDRPPTDFIIVDECRRAMAPTVKAVLDAYPNARLLGLDATPERADGSPLGDIFDAMVCGPSIKWLISKGFLVPAHVYSPVALKEGTLAEDPVVAYSRYAPNSKAIFFCRDVAHAQDVAAQLPAAALVTGETPRERRKEIREQLASGLLRQIVNVDVYKDGADLPTLECVVLCRGMGVCSTYLQAAGRGARAYPGKSRYVLIDLAGAAILHGLPEDDREWSLTGDAVKRVGVDLKVALARCRNCLAVIHAGPSACPRCGAPMKGTRVKRRATRIERQELQRLDTRPESIRQRIALEGISRRLRATGRFKSEAQIAHLAWKLYMRQTRKRASA